MRGNTKIFSLKLTKTIKKLNSIFISFESQKILFFISHLFFNIVLFIVSIFAAKWSGPESWGLITFFMLLATYSGILTLGINNGIGIILPMAIIQKKDSQIKKILSTSAISITISSLLICFFHLILSYSLNLKFSNFLSIFILTISIQTLNYFKVLLRSYENFRLLAFTFIIQGIILILSFLVIGKEINYIIILSTMNIISSLYIYVRFKKNLNYSIKFIKKTYFRIFRIGFPVMIAGIVGELLLTMDRLIIAFFFDNFHLGQYGFSSNFFKGIRVIGVSISIMTLPKIAKCYAKKDFNRMLYYARTQQWVSFYLMIIASLITAFIIYNYVPLYIPEFSKSTVVSLILLSTANILPFALYPNILNVIGKQKLYLASQLFIIILNIIISLIFINLGFGIEGVASGSLISIICYVFLIRYIGKKTIKVLFLKR